MHITGILGIITHVKGAGMAIFDRFRRKKSYDIKDVDAHYVPKARKPGVAILLGVLSFVVTFVIILALFFGGRWIYRQINDENDKGTTTSQQAQTNNPQTESSQSKANTSGGGATSSTSTNQPRQAAPPTQATPTTPSTPVLGDDNQALPRTGDEGL